MCSCFSHFFIESGISSNPLNLFLDTFVYLKYTILFILTKRKLAC